MGDWLYMQNGDDGFSGNLGGGGQQYSNSKGQKISKQNCRAVTSPKKQTNKFVFYPDDSEILET